MINYSCKKTDILHVVLCSDTERDKYIYQSSNMIKYPTVADRISWFDEFKKNHKIQIHHLVEDGIPTYPNGWIAWSELVKDFLYKADIAPQVVFTSEEQDARYYQLYLNLKVIFYDIERAICNVSATDIRNNPLKYMSFMTEKTKQFFMAPT